MSPINSEFFEKILEAKQLEKEAIMMLLPEKIKSHLDVISNEVKAMVIETMMEIVEKQSSTEEHKNKSTSKVKKVDIG